MCRYETILKVFSTYILAVLLIQEKENAFAFSSSGRWSVILCVC